MSEIPREPQEYFLSIHAGQQMRDRGIDYDVIAQAIREGEVQPAAQAHQREFILELPYYDDPVGVIVDIQDGEIITVEWRYKR